MYLELKHVNKSYGDFKASDDVSFDVEKGELTALLGPSGSGKTTILRMIAGLEKADSGDILIDGKRVNDIPASSRGIGFVFQNYALFRYMTVYDNIAFGLQVKKIARAEIDGLLLLDEPFAAIDAKVRKGLRQWLREMIHRVGVTSIFVTHDQEEAVEVADEIIVMDQGRVEQEGSPYAIYKTPETAFVARFVGEPVVVEEFGKLNGFDKGDYDWAIIRPEFVEAFKSDNAHFQHAIPYAQKGVIKDIVFKGSALELRLDVDGIELISRRSLERRPICVGEEMNVIIYRLFAMKGSKAVLMQNSDLVSLDPDGRKLEKYLYGEGGYFVG